MTGATGTDQTVRLLDAMLRAAGLRSLAVGEVGLPVVEAVMDPEPYDVLAVGLTRRPAPRGRAMRRTPPRCWRRRRRQPGTSAVDRLAMGPRLRPGPAWPASTTSPTPAPRSWCVDADVREGARAIGVTLGMPGVGMLGLVEDLVADRAFIEERATSAAELCTLADLPVDDVAAEPETVRNVLAAAALARAVGAPRAAVRDGLRAVTPRLSGRRPTPPTAPPTAGGPRHAPRVAADRHRRRRDLTCTSSEPTGKGPA